MFKSKVIKLVLFATLALVLLGVLFTFSTGHVSAQVKEQAVPQGTNCQDYSDWQPGYALLYWTRISGQVCSDGSRVWFTRVDCSYYGVGVSVSFTYCGRVHDNDSWGEIGSNWQASFIYNGSPISYPGYQRVDYDKNGNITRSYGIG